MYTDAYLDAGIGIKKIVLKIIKLIYISMFSSGFELCYSLLKDEFCVTA